MLVHQRATRSIPAARYSRRSSNSGLILGRYAANELTWPPCDKTFISTRDHFFSSVFRLQFVFSTPCPTACSSRELLRPGEGRPCSFLFRVLAVGRHTEAVVIMGPLSADDKQTQVTHGNLSTEKSKT